MKNRKCKKCEKMIPMIEANAELSIPEDYEEIHVMIICPHCEEQSEFAIIEDNELIRADY